MTKDSSEMYYLDSLVSAEFKKDVSKPPGSRDQVISFLVDKTDKSVKDILDEKIELIRKLRRLAASDVKVAAKFFAPFVAENWFLIRIYSAKLHAYKKAIREGTQEPDDRVLIEVADKMILATILEIYLSKDRKTYHEAVKTLEQVLYDLSSKRKDLVGGYDSKLEFEYDLPNSSSFAQEVRVRHRNWNFARLFFTRLWRTVTKHLTKALADCKAYLDGLELAKQNGLGKFFGYLGWVFFLPRIITNITTNIYSVIGVWSIFGKYKLSPLEKEYGWLLRLKTSLNVNWVELANDMMWFTNGIIGCFFLAGFVPVVGVYIMLAAQIYDFLVIITRNYVESRRLDHMKSKFAQLSHDNELNLEDDFLFKSLSRRIDFDKKVLIYAISNFAILLMCIAFLTPGFGAISPFIPLAFGIVTVLTAIYHGRNVLFFEKERKKLFGGSLIPEGSYGVVSVTEDPTTLVIDANKPLLGKYSKGFIRYYPDTGSNASSVYFYDKNQDPEHRIVPVPNYILDKFDEVAQPSSRVKTLFKKDASEFCTINEVDACTQSDFNNNTSRVFSILGGFG